MKDQDIIKENESLRARIREVEDENQELQTQSLMQNRTILSMRSELALMRVQLDEMAVTSALLTDRVRQMMQQSQRDDNQSPQNNETQITTPPLMAPPPPPPLSPAYIRVSPRQVGAGEALLSRLGLTMPTPQRHRIKRDIRQPMQRLFRSPLERRDLNNTSPTQSSLITSSNMARLTKIPQLRTSFFCSRAGASNNCDGSASDSSDSDGPQVPQTGNKTTTEEDSAVLRPTILHNYNFTFPVSTANLFLPVNWDRKDKDNHTLPSTSKNVMDEQRPESSYDFQAVKVPKVSECIQYTFPKVHEGSHQTGIHTVATAIGQTVRKKRSQNEMSSGNKNEEAATSQGCDRSEEEMQNNVEFESESQSSTDDEVRRRKKPERGSTSARDRRFDIEQDGFQADESSNCLTSTENSLERVAIREADLEKN